MNKKNIENAVSEARRFLSRYKDIQDDPDYDTTKFGISGTPATGALRRASMDITRALAKMRRSN